MVVWVKGLEEEQTAAMIELLANGLLADMKHRDETPDAAFRASFRLNCVAAVDITRDHTGQAVKMTPKPEISAKIAAKVKVAVFADSERKEKEAAEAAAAAAALEAEAEAERERIAALPGQLKEAAKKGGAEGIGAQHSATPTI